MISASELDFHFRSLMSGVKIMGAHDSRHHHGTPKVELFRWSCRHSPERSSHSPRKKPSMVCANVMKCCLSSHMKHAGAVADKRPRHGGWGQPSRLSAESKLRGFYCSVVTGRY